MERRRAVATRLLEKLENFKKEFEVFKASLDGDANELGLKADELVSLSIIDESTKKISDEATTMITALNKSIDNDDPPGLQKRLGEVEAKIDDLQSKLDAPNRAYQTYLSHLTEWQDRRAKIEGSDTDTESLNGLKATLAALDQLPANMAEIKVAQSRLPLQIHSEKLAQTEVYRKLKGPVQQFIDSHALAKNKLKLEFRAELTNEDFSTRLLDLLALNRRGSFMGVDEGQAKADALVEVASWENAESVRSFLNNIDTALHFDKRDNPPLSVQLKDQVLRGKKTEEVSICYTGWNICVQSTYYVGRGKIFQCDPLVSAEHFYWYFTYSSIKVTLR